MKKKKSISKKVRQLVLKIAVFSLILCTVIGIASMLRVRDRVLTSEYELGKTASKTSELALTKQVKKNMLELVVSRASNLSETLSRFENYISLSASYLEKLYAEPERFAKEEVLPPDKANAGVLTMQRYLRGRDVSPAAIEDEVGLLGNIVDIWKPVMTFDGGVINSVFVGTESGIFMCYNKDSDITDNEYWDYSDKGWYVQAQYADGPTFTDTYQDIFGRGLTTGCTAAFHYPDGRAAGVVCMNILIKDIVDSVTSLDLGKNTFAFIVDETGSVIVAPDMPEDGEFDNISTDLRHPAFGASSAIMSGYTGVKHMNSGIYFAYAPIPSTGWTLVLQIAEEDVNEPVYKIKSAIEDNSEKTEQEINGYAVRSLYMYIAAFILITAAVVLASRRFSNRLTKPVTELIEDVRHISGGELDYRTDVESNDEIGELADEFNGMAASLQKYIGELTAITAEKERIGAELNIATQIQASMLPCIFPPFPDHNEFDIFASMDPAKEVGGDFYDFYLIDKTHLALTIADVSGKGVPAALFMVISKSLLKSSAQSGYSPAQVLESINAQLCENNAVGMFVTVWLGILDLTTGKMVCANAGHEYPVIRRKGGKYELFKDRHGFVLGGMEMSRYKDYELDLAEGDRIFVYTDGLTEAADSCNELFGIDRMLSALNSHPDSDCTQLIAEITADVNAFVGGAPQFDDMTMLAFEIKNYISS